MYFKAALGVALIAAGWLAVELTWRRVFGKAHDARLAGCRGCTTCERRCKDTGGADVAPDSVALPRAHATETATAP